MKKIILGYNKKLLKVTKDDGKNLLKTMGNTLKISKPVEIKCRHKWEKIWNENDCVDCGNFEFKYCELCSEIKRKF